MAGLSWPGAAGVLAANRGFLQLSSQSCTERVPKTRCGVAVPSCCAAVTQAPCSRVLVGSGVLYPVFLGGRLRPSGSHCHNGSLEKKTSWEETSVCVLCRRRHKPPRASPDPPTSPRSATATQHYLTLWLLEPALTQRRKQREQSRDGNSRQ